MTDDLRTALERKRILVVCGSGGVGKTSVSAALALAGAAERRAMVLTIDPARRLASALGLGDAIGHDTTPVDVGSGTLDAAMLDMKSAWDDLVARYAPDADVAQRITTNRLYQGLSEHFVGSQGYMAMERLADLHDRGEHDLIVIDTPPTRSALDFLEAPKRMTDFIGGSLLRWLSAPYRRAGKVGLRAFNLTATPFLKIADRVLGSQVLEDLSAFVLDFQTLYDDFKRRADEVLALLRDERTGFVVVTTLEGPPFGEAGFFIDRLTDEGLPLSGVIANKVIDQRFDSPETSETVDALRNGTAVQTYARTALETLSGIARRDRRRLDELHRRANRPVATVPLLARDVHDVDGLRDLAGYLIG